MDDLERARIYAIQHVCPITHDPVTPYELGAVTALTSYTLSVLRNGYATERARCISIVLQYTDDLQPGPVQIAARDMLAAIEEEWCTTAL